jgi:flavodoxin
MNRLKNIATILLLSLALTSCGQSQPTGSKNGSYKVLAKLISFEGGDKVHFTKFKIIKDLSDSLLVNDILIVGYYNYKEPDENIDNVLLNIKKYDGQTPLKNYFICHDYDGKNNIQKAKIEYIDFDYWQACETGKGHCKPLTFFRTANEENWFLIMPCGGTGTAITISGKDFKKEMHLHSANCPPYLDLSKLRDGKYFANMSACGLGGTISFNLTTSK